MQRTLSFDNEFSGVQHIYRHSELRKYKILKVEGRIVDNQGSDTSVSEVHNFFHKGAKPNEARKPSRGAKSGIARTHGVLVLVISL